MKATVSFLIRSLRADRRRARRAIALILIAVLATHQLPTPVSAADGDLDLSFGTGGIVMTDLGGGGPVAIQTDGKILVRGSGLLRYNTDGSLDSTFGIGGKANPNFGGAVAVVVQPDGKIIVAGDGLLRYNADGVVFQI